MTVQERAETIEHLMRLQGAFVMRTEDEPDRVVLVVTEDPFKPTTEIVIRDAS